ncbi:unnamed protein product, partial [Ectocarpus sp. 12 AP-2014]
VAAAAKSVSVGATAHLPSFGPYVLHLVLTPPIHFFLLFLLLLLLPLVRGGVHLPHVITYTGSDGWYNVTPFSPVYPRRPPSDRRSPAPSGVQLYVEGVPDQR